jgi:hypothetical protein
MYKSSGSSPGGRIENSSWYLYFTVRITVWLKRQLQGPAQIQVMKVQQGNSL